MSKVNKKTENVNVRVMGCNYKLYTWNYNNSWYNEPCSNRNEEIEIVIKGITRKKGIRNSYLKQTSDVFLKKI